MRQARRIRFIKMVATGNDFILLDLRRHRAPSDLASLARRLCQRSRAIGADGILTIEPSPRATVKMRVINPDGSEAEMCGNGARCVALVAAQGRPRQRITIETKAGVVEAVMLTPRRVQVGIPAPSPATPIHLTALMRPYTVHSINTGVPHAVLFVEELRRVDLRALGAAIRRHRRFRPDGTNVNFVEVLDRRTLRLRTYERGVEHETLACGTGAVAAALTAAGLGLADPPVNVYPTSGERLVIRFKNSLTGFDHRLQNATVSETQTFEHAGRSRSDRHDRHVGCRFQDVLLEGEVRKTFDGVVTV